MVIMAATVIAAYFFGLHVYASLAAVCFYLGCEHAQSEQRVITQHYNNKRANAPCWCEFDRGAWTVKCMLDWLLPLVVFIITSVAA